MSWSREKQTVPAENVELTPDWKQTFDVYTESYYGSWLIERVCYSFEEAVAECEKLQHTAKTKIEEHLTRPLRVFSQTPAERLE